MMAEKARLFGDEQMLAAILTTDQPKEMKAFSRAVQNFNQDIWQRHCLVIVKKGNLEKFRKNPVLLAYLLGTEGRILVEACPKDQIWGIGMAKQNPDAQNPLKWHGDNWLGFTLTEVRDLLQVAGG